MGVESKRLRIRICAQIHGWEFPSAFSFPFHKEDSSSTVSAQLNIDLPLRMIPYSRKVFSVQT
jgi:hypothetical protein